MFGKKKGEIEKFKIPKTVQDIIPIKVLYKNGMAYMGENRYTKVYRFLDINYSSASANTKEVMLELYQECLNSFECGEQTKITVVNRKLHKDEVERQYMMEFAEDGYDEYRKEYNDLFESKLEAIHHSKQDKLLTVTCNRQSEDLAKNYFERAEEELRRVFKRLGSNIHPVDANERIRIYYDFFHAGQEELFQFDINEYQKIGRDFKDYLAPSGIEVKNDYLIIGDKYVRVLYFKDYAPRVKDDIIEQLTGLEQNVMCSMDVYPVRSDEAHHIVETIMDSIEMEATRWQKNQTKNGVVPFDIPYQIKERRRNIQSFANELGSGNQMMMLQCITLMHMADSLEELNDETKKILALASGYSFELSKLKFQQLQALNTVLPYGGKKRIAPLRTLISRGVASFIPFSVQNFQDKDGIYYGINSISREIISINNWGMMNYNFYVIGVSGSGKSFMTKEIITQTMLTNPNVDVIIVDPENEYEKLVEAFGGDNINISSTSKSYMNAMEISAAYGDDEDPIIVKSEFMLSFCEQAIGEQNMTAGKRSIITRCVSKVLGDYRNRGYQGEAPTLCDLYEEIKRQPEEDARILALELEMYVEGTMSIFSHQTNVNINNRLVCFDIKNMSEQLQPVGMLVVLDFVWNRITSNRNNGRLTLVFIDEIQLVFAHKRSAEYIERIWKRVRKYGCGCCGILQNASSINNKSAKTTITNSQFAIIMNQRSNEEEALEELFDVSPEQLEYVVGVPQGRGLIYVNDTNSLVPFENAFPTDTRLYELMSTKPVTLE